MSGEAVRGSANSSIMAAVALAPWTKMFVEWVTQNYGGVFPSDYDTTLNVIASGVIVSLATAYKARKMAGKPGLLDIAYALVTRTKIPTEAVTMRVENPDAMVEKVIETKIETPAKAVIDDLRDQTHVKSPSGTLDLRTTSIESTIGKLP